jgi:hypothetical protein
VSAGEYAAGVAFFVVTVGCSGLTAALVLRSLSHLNGVARGLAAALLFTAALLVAHMVPGVLGILTRGTVAAVAIAGSLGAWAYSRRAPARVEREADGPPGEPEGLLPRAAAGLAAAAIAIFLIAYFRTAARQAVTSNDMLNFHLPLLASWIQGGSFWPVFDFLPYDTTGNYPQNGDVLMLATVLPWRADTFARLAMLPYIGMAGLSAYALARELRVGPWRAALMGSVLVSIPIVLVAGVVSALPDVAMYGTFGAGLVFLARAARTQRDSDALIAGIGLGIALGTKWYAVPAVVAIVGLFALALLVERRGVRAAIRNVGMAAGAVALCGGFWLVRNAVESGSPFFPAGWLPIGARSDVGNPAPRSDFPIAHYLFDADVWRRVILPDELKAFGVGGVVLLAGLVVSAVLATTAVRRGERSARIVLWAIAASVLLAIVYAITPNTASGFEGEPVLVFYSARYVVPAAIPAVAVLGWLATRLGRWSPVVDLLAIAAVGDGLRRAFDLPASDVVVGALGVGLLAAVASGLARLWRAPAELRRGRVALVGAATAVLVLAAGYKIERTYSKDRLVGKDATIDRFLATTRDGDRVGITGQWSVVPPSPVHPMFGERFHNHVDYVGEWSEGVNKPYRSQAAFTADLRKGRYDWLMVGRGIPPAGDPPAMSWAATAGYRLAAQTPRLALYRAP